MVTLTVSRRPRYRNFGYIPTGSLRRDVLGKLFGQANLIKRLQAPDIMELLQLQPDHVALDFGCGGGFMTVEMAKCAGKAVGVDVAPALDHIRVPRSLEGRLEYHRACGTRLPFDAGTFDVILASEVLPMIPHPDVFLGEMRRVLKAGGRLVVANGAGHPAIADAYRNRPWYFRLLQRRYADRVPESYEEYCRILQQSFTTAVKRFYSEDDVRDMLARSGFQVRDVRYSPGALAGGYLSWSQFLLYLRKGATLSQRRFVPRYVLLRLLRFLERGRHRGGLLIAATAE